MIIHLITAQRKHIQAPLAAMVIGVASLLAPAAPVSADVEIVFSDYLQDKMSRISLLDKKREEVFRQFRTDGTRSSISSRASLNRSRFSRTEWANERLIPDIDNYDVPSLIRAMMERGIQEADPDFDGKVITTIETLKVASFPHTALNSFNTRIAGNIQMLDAAGNLVAEHDISAYLVPKYTGSRHYTGPEYAYRSGALSTRVGPIAAEFTEKALEKMFPVYDAPGLIVLLD